MFGFARGRVGGPEPVLCWACTGGFNAVVGQQRLLIAEGEGLWIPAGESAAVELFERSVALPIIAASRNGRCGPTEFLRVPIPPGWADWLWYRFASCLGYLHSRADDDGLQTLLNGPTQKVGSTRFPPLPISSPARQVAEEIQRFPATDLAAACRRAGASMRTVQRQFRAETQLTITQWREQSRMIAACELLAEGTAVNEVAWRVGYQTVGGFCGAFAAAVGQSPARWASAGDGSRIGGHRTAQQAHPEIGQPVTQECQVEQRTPNAPKIGDNSTWSRVNKSPVLVWAYRGPAQVRVVKRWWRLEAGEAMVLPAGLENQILLPAGSVLLPVAFGLDHRVLSLEELRVAQVSDEWCWQRWVMASYTPLRPPGYSVTAAFAALAADLLGASANQHSQSRKAVEHIVQAVTKNPAHGHTMAQWSAQLQLAEADLRQTFADLTGQGFEQYQRRIRMTHARVLLYLGEAPATVCRRVGYAHLSGFSKAFRGTYGLSPRQFQDGLARRRQWTASQWAALRS